LAEVTKLATTPKVFVGSGLLPGYMPPGIVTGSEVGVLGLTSLSTAGPVIGTSLAPQVVVGSWMLAAGLPTT
jgi:hypothetical protein